MSIKIGKYEFNDESQAQSKIDALPENNNHCIVKLGNIVTEEAVYDEEGIQTQEPVLSSSYHVDVLWKDLDSHPFGWATYSINLDNEGVHVVSGLSYLENKM